MRLPSFRTFALAAATLPFLHVTTATADELPAKWEAQRQIYTPLSQAACKGDQQALAKLTEGALGDRNPAALNSYYWLKTNSTCEGSTATTPQLRGLLEEAAKSGYPIAMSNLGKSQLTALRGFKQDVASGEKWLMEAANAGYGNAAGYLAAQYIRGGPLKKNLTMAELLISKAESEGVSPDMTNMYRGMLYEAKGDMESAMASYDKVQNQGPFVKTRKRVVAKEMANKPVFAALYASVEEGGFGWSYDFDTQDGAEARARDECKSKGGKSCAPKIVLQGRGCASYTYAPGGSPYGWGVAKERADAEARARQECSSRNGGAACSGGSGWICNSRTQDDLKVVFEAENNSKAEAKVAAATDTCRVEYRQICNNWFGSTFNGHLQKTVRVHSFSRTISFPGCASGKDGRISFNWYKGKWGSWKGQKQVSPEIAAQVKSAMFAYRDEVNAKYPQCGQIETALIVGAPEKDSLFDHDAKRCTTRLDDLRRKDKRLVSLCID